MGAIAPAAEPIVVEAPTPVSTPGTTLAADDDEATGELPMPPGLQQPEPEAEPQPVAVAPTPEAVPPEASPSPASDAPGAGSDTAPRSRVVWSSSPSSGNFGSDRRRDE